MMIGGIYRNADSASLIAHAQFLAVQERRRIRATWAALAILLVAAAFIVMVGVGVIVEAI